MISATVLVAAIAYLVWVFHKPGLVLAHAKTRQRYLTRYHLVFTKHLCVFLHRLDGPDPDEHLHNHPWKGLAIVLRKPGSYVQREAAKTSVNSWFTRFRSIGRLNWLTEDYHKIERVTPGTWTLCICGPYQERGWGFLVDGVHVPFEEYFKTHQVNSIRIR